jgi:hypothetical protein
MWARPGTVVGVVAAALTSVLLGPPSTGAEKTRADTVEKGEVSETPAASVPQKQRRRMRRHGPETARARQKNTPLHGAAAANDRDWRRRCTPQLEPDTPR